MPFLVYLAVKISADFFLFQAVFLELDKSVDPLHFLLNELSDPSRIDPIVEQLKLVYSKEKVTYSSGHILGSDAGSYPGPSSISSESSLTVKELAKSMYR